MAPGELVPEAMRQRQHPLPDRHIREHVVDQVRGALGHPAPATAGADRPTLTGGQREETIGPARSAPAHAEDTKRMAAPLPEHAWCRVRVSERRVVGLCP